MFLFFIRREPVKECGISDRATITPIIIVTNTPIDNNDNILNIIILNKIIIMINNEY